MHDTNEHTRRRRAAIKRWPIHDHSLLTVLSIAAVIAIGVFATVCVHALAR